MYIVWNDDVVLETLSGFYRVDICMRKLVFSKMSNLFIFFFFANSLRD